LGGQTTFHDSGKSEHAESDNFRRKVRALTVDFLRDKELQFDEVSYGAYGGGPLWHGPLFEILRDVSSGGKGLRSAFCYWGWRASGGRPEDEHAVVRAAASLEMLHAFALIHDDIMDESLLRRGRPTAHRRLTELHARHGWRGSADWFGITAGILLGDLCQSWSYEMLFGIALPAETRGALIGLTDRGNSDLMVGQYLDLLQQARGHGSVIEATVVQDCEIHR
jgi:geranylgeranyl diphosphate synthase type I